MITLGLDIGTSGVKAALVDEDDVVIASASVALTVNRPAPGFSEQDPQDWWNACCGCLDQIRQSHPKPLSRTAAIGLSGQMHGAVLLNEQGQVLRPCILWNDVRSQPQCAELLARFAQLHAVTGNAAMPGFTAPKLLWVREHEPEVFGRTAKVLLPKAYVRYRLTGLMIEDMSDASGTLWLDVGARAWSGAALSACGMRPAQMPALVEGSAPAGELSAQLCQRWGFMQPPLLAGGAGDNAAGAVALGAVSAGDGFVSLGTSGVLWATTAHYAPKPELGLHTFCHAVPDTWHQMGVMLSAASCLAWWARVSGCNEEVLLEEAANSESAAAACWFVPYLSGERTPHNDGVVRGGFFGLEHATSRGAMTYAVLAGVAYAFRDSQQAMAQAGTHLREADVIGGGARSVLWTQMLADVLALPLHQIANSELGCALGAARLARMASLPPDERLAVAAKPQRIATFEPRAAQCAQHAERYAHWRTLYALARAAVPA